MPEKHSSPTIFSYHPATYLRDPIAGIEAIHAVYDLDVRKSQLGQTAGLLETLEMLSISKFSERMNLEKMMLSTQMNLRRPELRRHKRLTERSSRLGDLVRWFDATSEKVPQDRSHLNSVYDGGLKRSKGLAISLGVEVQGGLWPPENTGTARTARLVASLAEQLENFPEYDVRVPEDETGAKIAYLVTPLASASGEHMKFARLERSRSVADIDGPSERVLHVAKKVTALVQIDAMPADWRRSYRRWKDVTEESAFSQYGKHLSVSIGPVFEAAAITRDGNESGIYPESSSHMLRAPHLMPAKS